MKIGVIGAEGFLGSHLVEYIEAQGHEVAKGDIWPMIDEDCVIDVTDGVSVSSWFTINKPDAVITLAGLLGTHELFGSVPKAINVNTLGQYLVAIQCLYYNIPMVTIEQPHVWTNPYETTRGAGVNLARGLALSKGLNLATVTVFNAFGEGQAYGGDHPQKIVPTFAVYGHNDRPAPIYGDGTQWTNLIYAGDIARILFEAIEVTDPGAPNLYGVSEQGNYTVNDVWAMISDMTHCKREPAYLPMRDGETNTSGAKAQDWMMRTNENKGVYVPKYSASDLYATVTYYAGVGIEDEVPR